MTTIKSIDVETTRYDGRDFPEAARYDEYVAAELAERFPGAEITVSFGDQTRVNAYGADGMPAADVAEDLASEVKVDMWDAFCGEGYKAYSV